MGEGKKKTEIITTQSNEYPAEECGIETSVSIVYAVIHSCFIHLFMIFFHISITSKYDSHLRNACYEKKKSE